LVIAIGAANGYTTTIGWTIGFAWFTFVMILQIRRRNFGASFYMSIVLTVSFALALLNDLL
jgi:hypothetical protein